MGPVYTDNPSRFVYNYNLRRFGLRIGNKSRGITPVGICTNDDVDIPVDHNILLSEMIMGPGTGLAKYVYIFKIAVVFR